MEFPALESGSIRRRRWSMPRISALLVPLQLGLRLCVYLSLLAISLLLTYVILETCWHAFDYLDRENGLSSKMEYKTNRFKIS